VEKTPNFRSTLVVANEFRNFAYARRALRFDGGPIAGIFGAYTSIAFDHHASICLLLNYNIATSAFALLRCLVDTCYRAAWLSMYGTDEERINKVLRDEKNAFPPFEQMEAAVGAKGHPRMNKETWQALNSFTHSGAQQLFSQVNSEGMIQASFDDDQLVSCLRLASQHLQVIVAVHVLMSGDEKIAHEVVKEYYRLFGG
jgi:hypothetical protein